MYCTKCGAQNPDESKFCKNCGSPLAGAAPGGQPFVQPQPAPDRFPEHTNWNISAFASPNMGLVLGILSFFLSPCALFVTCDMPESEDSTANCFVIFGLCLLAAGIVYFSTRTRTRHERTGGAKIASVILSAGTVIGIIGSAIDGVGNLIAFSFFSLPCVILSLLYLRALKKNTQK